MKERSIFFEKESASYVGLSESTLRKARLYGQCGRGIVPPPFVRLGRAVRYRIEDLDMWLESRVVRVTTIVSKADA